MGKGGTEAQKMSLKGGADEKFVFSRYVLVELVRKDVKVLLWVSTKLSQVSVELRALILDFREDSLQHDNVLQRRLVE